MICYIEMSFYSVYNKNKEMIILSIIPFVSVKGALSAFELYKEVFNAELVGETTMLQSIKGFEGKEYEGKVGHMTVRIGDSKFFMNDFLEKNLVKMGENIQFVLDLKNEEFLRRSFAILSREGKVVQELHEVFWGALFGAVKDKFGVVWQIYYGHK